METATPEVKWLESRTTRFDDLVEIANATSAVRVSPETAIRTSSVLSCVRVLSETIAALPLVLYRRVGEDKERASDLPLSRILGRRPNTWQTRFEFIEGNILHLCLYGNSYNLIVPGDSGAVTELHPLHPAGMKCQQLPDMSIRYIYQPPGTGRQIIYRDEQIMHTRWLSLDAVTGMVPIELGKDAIMLARSLEQHASRFFANNAMPGLVLHTDQALPREIREQLREQWDSRHSGAQRAGRTAVLSNGLKVETIGSSLEANQFAELRTQSILDVCRVFRMPPHLVQELGRATWGNIESEQISFVSGTIVPWLRRLEGSIERDLLTNPDELFAEFLVEGLLRGDTITRYQAYEIGLRNGWLTVGEVRRRENLNPLPANTPAAIAATPTPAAGRSVSSDAWKLVNATLPDVTKRAMTISIDFDETFSKDPVMWGEFAMKADAQGNTVYMITRREDTPENQAEIEATIGQYADAFTDVLLIGAAMQKEDGAKAAGIAVDVWIDDSPETIQGENQNGN